MARFQIHKFMQKIPEVPQRLAQQPQDLRSPVQELCKFCSDGPNGHLAQPSEVFLQDLHFLCFKSFKYRGSMSQNISLAGGLTPTPNILSFPLAPDAGRRGMWLASSIRSLSRKDVPKCPKSYHLTMRPLPDARVGGWNMLKWLDPAWLRCKV